MSAIQPSLVRTSTMEFSPFQISPHGLNGTSMVDRDERSAPHSLPSHRRLFAVSNSRQALDLAKLPHSVSTPRPDTEMVKRTPRASTQIRERGSASPEEILDAMSVILGEHRDLEGLLSSLALGLARIVDFAVIGIARYDEPARKVHWHLSMPDGSMKRGTIDWMREQTESGWTRRHQKPLIVPHLEDAIRLDGKIKGSATDGMGPLCEIPLTLAHRRIGSFLIGAKRPGICTEDEILCFTSIAEMIAPSVNDAFNAQALRSAHAELQNERDRLSLLLELNGHVVASSTLRAMLQVVSSTVRRAMRCDAVAVHLPDPATSRLQLFTLDSSTDEQASKEGVLLTSSGCRRRFPGDVYKTGEPMLMEQAGADSRCPDVDCAFCRAVFDEIAQSVCVLPLKLRDRVLGVLELVRRREPAFSHADLDFLCKAAGQIAIAIENSLAHQQITNMENQLARESAYLEDAVSSERGFEEIVGRSATIRGVLRMIETVAPTNSTVLICGETGTGKELIARAIHERSPRSSNPFVKLNCAAIPAGLLESEIFGHERGAFTGAVAQRIGRFELANRGTAFLDEIGDLPLELQPKLLRVLQEKEFERLGGTRTLQTDVRLIAATNRNLAECVKEKSFRDDLYYRLNVFPIHVPALRERQEDIPLLVRHFVQVYARRMGRCIETIPSEAMEALVKHPWPGNIRELQNLIEHAVILSSGPVLKVPMECLRSANTSKGNGSNPRTLDEAERDFILTTLKEAKGKISGPGGAAGRLGLKRTTLQRKMQRLGIMKADYV